MSDIICIRMIGGEEIMGERTGGDDASIVVRDPAALHMVPNERGQMQLGLLPWLPYSEDREFAVPKHAIITTHKPSVDLLNNYNRLFGSGIQIASAGSLNG